MQGQKNAHTDQRPDIPIQHGLLLRKQFKTVLTLALVFFAFTTAANGQTAPALQPDSDIFAKSTKALTVLLVTSVLIENALAVIFNWRVFLAYFSLRGIRTIVTFSVSLAVVSFFDLDAVSWLFSEYSPTEVPSNWMSKTMSALILSGGSSGVHNIMRTIGYRDIARVDEIVPKSRADKAWLAIWIDRETVVGPVNVNITEVDASETEVAAIAGTIGGKRPSIIELLFRNPNRFPENGGYYVTPDQLYKIAVAGTNKAGQPIIEDFGGNPMKFAPGAIVDFRVKL